MACISSTEWELRHCGGAGISDALAEVVTPALQAALGGGISASFVVGAEGGDVINVAIQVEDADGDDLAGARLLYAWLSDTAAAAVSATPPDGDVVIGTDGVVVEEYSSDLSFQLLTDATGLVDLDIGESAVDTWFLNVQLPDGSVVSSATITFA